MNTMPSLNLTMGATYLYSSVPLKFNKSEHETLARSGALLTDSAVRIVMQPLDADYIETACCYNWARSQGSIQLTPNTKLISTWHREHEQFDYVGILTNVPGQRHTFTVLHAHHSVVPPHFYEPNSRSENFNSSTGIVEYRDLRIEFDVIEQRITRLVRLKQGW